MPNKPESLDYVFWWLSPILLLVIGAFCWVNHFDAGFHRDDFPNIVENRHIRNADVGELLRSPRAFSHDTSRADYRPLLSLLFAFDYSVREDGSPAFFQMSSFLWFLPMPFLFYALARAVPDCRHQTALFTAALFAVHPLVSDTLNYVSRRGELIAAAGVVAALAIWTVWPERLPSTLGFDLYRIPKTWQQEFIFKYGARIDAFYKTLLRAPGSFYFVPLLFALFCSPWAAAFACIGAVWVWVYPSSRSQAQNSGAGWARLVPGAVVCAAWLLLHTVLTWEYQAPLRLPAGQYWLGQPGVAVQYFLWFFTPFNMSADAGLLPELRLWSPDILLGIAGLGALIFLAVYTRRKAEWRPVSFGIGWFLAAQVPFALIPQTTADSAARMFIPMLGLVIALGHTMMWVAEKVQTLPRFNVPASLVWSTFMLVLLGTMSWLTFERNRIWVSDLTLTADNVKRSPGNQRALIQYAWEMIKNQDVTVATEYVERAHKAPPQDAFSEVLVAEALDRIGRDKEADAHYARATALWPRYAAAMSSYGKWLLTHQRHAEATDWSLKAVRLNHFDNQARHNLMEIHSAAFEWDSVRRVAREALLVDPEDAQAKLAVLVSQDAIDRVGRAERTLPGNASANDYLSLSVAHYRAKRYQDCVDAAQAAMKADPELAEPHANMATCYHSMGKDDEAIAELRELVRLRPDISAARLNLEFLLREKAERGSKK